MRRVTGGGAVYHDFGNLNYTIVGNSENLEKDYPEYAGWMAQALQSLGVPATLSGRNDILVEGRKVSGFAKRVCKTRLMVHGTLMYDVDIETLTKALNPSSIKLQSKGIASVRSRVANLKEYLADFQDIHSFKNRLEQILSRNYEDQEYILSNQDLESIRQLAEEKFAQKNWIYGHAPKATYHNSAHWPCGNIQVHMDIASGKITSCRLDGDFIGNLPIDELEKTYMVKKKTIERIVAKDEIAIFYTFELSSSFNSEEAINFFDNQRRKNAGNIQAGEFIDRNIDIENTANIIFDNFSAEEYVIEASNVLQMTLGAPLIK